jgi:hypothetical protein
MKYKLFEEKGKYRHIDTQIECNMVKAGYVAQPRNAAPWAEYADDATAMAAFKIELIPVETPDTGIKIDMNTSHSMDVNQLSNAVEQQQAYINSLEAELRQAHEDLRTLRRQKSTGIKLGGGIKIMSIGKLEKIN